MKELEKVLGEELYVTVSEKLQEKKLLLDDRQLIPKHRFDCINISLREHKQKVKELEEKIRLLSTVIESGEKIKQENLALSKFALELLSNKITQNEESIEAKKFKEEKRLARWLIKKS